MYSPHFVDTTKPGSISLLLVRVAENPVPLSDMTHSLLQTSDFQTAVLPQVCHWRLTLEVVTTKIKDIQRFSDMEAP